MPSFMTFVDTLHASYRQVDYWLAEMRLIPGYVADPGSGNRRSLTTAQRQVLVVMDQLVHAGMHPRAAAQLATALVDGDHTARLGDAITIHLDTEAVPA